jgi:FkbM family methyltransferase
MLQTITPFRQMARIYGGFLSAVRSLSELTKAKELQAQQMREHAEQMAGSLRDLASRLVASDTAQRRYDGSRVDVYGRMELKLLLDRASLVDRAVIESGTWEAPQTEYLIGLAKHFMKDDPVFLDLGAYWGLYSLLAMRAGVRRIHAFDADRHNFAQLEAQIFLNDASSFITPHNKAISSTAGTVTFRDSRTAPGGNRAGAGVVGTDGGFVTVETPAVSIDEYFSFQGETIFLKLDLEGHEAQALEGMRKTIENNRVVLQIEMFPLHAADIMGVVETLGLRRIHSIEPDGYFTNISEL